MGCLTHQRVNRPERQKKRVRLVRQIKIDKGDAISAPPAEPIIEVYDTDKDYDDWD